MAPASHTTYKKRQKELARLEKRRDKAAKRLQRKQGKHPPSPENTTEEGSARPSPA
jgi:hypothetical protein